VSGGAFAPRRLVVGLDASPASLDALAGAVTLAARLGAAIEALFVQDEDLLRFASLPFADVVGAAASVGRLERGSAEAMVRAIGAQARAAVDRASAGGVACTLRVVQGRVIEEVLAAAERADLLVLGAGGHARSGPAAVGETARAAAARARSPVLLLARGASLDPRVIAVDDEGPSAPRTVEIARRLAPAPPGPTVLRASARGARTTLDAVLWLRPALVVLPAELAAGVAGALERLLAVGMPVLVAR
jgi:nucleotide-binding universal stress UspA family protein